MNEQPSIRSLQLEEELERAGLPLVVEIDGDRLVITGAVSTDAEREAALDIAADAVRDGLRLDENITVAGVVPEQMQDAALSQSEVAGFRGAEPDVEERESAMAGDFTDQETLTAPEDAQADSLSDDGRPLLSEDSPDTSEGGSVYVPPIDPVGTDEEVVGGFQESSMQSMEVERSSDGTIGDEALRDAVLRELREDAATAGLDLDVAVDLGIVRLRGSVMDITDVESAEEVSARVPGVVEVMEELEIEGGRST